MTLVFGMEVDLDACARAQFPMHGPGTFFHWPYLCCEGSGTSRTPVRNKQTPKSTCLLRAEHLGRGRTVHEADHTSTTIENKNNLIESNTGLEMHVNFSATNRLDTRKTSNFYIHFTVCFIGLDRY